MDMGEDFIKRQLKRQKRGLDDEIYDITTWSLPAAYGVPCLASHDTTEVPGDFPAPKAPALAKATVAYLVPAAEDGSPRALSEWLQAGLRVHVATQPTKFNGVAFGRGTLVLKVAGNPEAVHAAAEKAAASGLKVHATDTGFADEGAGLGGPNVVRVVPPKALLLVDRPADVSVGHTWYMMDQVWRYPVSRVAVKDLSRLDLGKYNVLIVPDGRYGKDGPEAGRLKDWVRQGGTLILIKGATEWAMGEKVGLLKARRETRPGSDKKDKLMPYPVPGAFLKATADDDEWLTFGVPAETNVLFNGDLVLSPLKREEGRNAVSFGRGAGLLASGYCWPDTLKLVAGKPYLVRQSLGEGQVVAFADDPNFRAMVPETQRMFVNAVMFGPAARTAVSERRRE
jgi:hypothetical protein